MEPQRMILTKTFGSYSSGTHFRMTDMASGTHALCETWHTNTPDRNLLEIPMELLTPARQRNAQMVPKINSKTRRRNKRAAFRKLGIA